MSRAPLHELIWSEEHSSYELYTRGQLTLRFRPPEEAAWLAWLREVSSFAFRCPEGSLNVYQEQRPRGGAYWYAYHTNRGRTHKRYLGRTENLSLVHLEEAARALLPEPKAAQAPEQGKPLLVSQLVPPRLPHSLVERERLLSMLDGALSTPLTLLSAPAGFGKTTLLSAWASQHKAQVAWLSLDELDNNSTRFWVSLIAALRRSARYAPRLGDTVVALLQSLQPPPLFSSLSALLQELGSRAAPSTPIVLIVDDYQVIEDPAIHEGMSFFLEHLPAHLHLILSSRVEPELPLARLRARGQLTEIRADDLRFRLEEVEAFLRQVMRLTLAEEEMAVLERRTEGWAAGLQLAALALRRHKDRATFLQTLTGSQRYLLDYVREDILARLRGSARTFLLHTAILSRLEASVCQAVTAEPTKQVCQQRLLFLERNNLFLVPLDEEQRYYRLHDLFREALLAHLSATQPEMVPLLHRRAASFYEAQGQWHEAITHWLAAADFSAAVRLMERTVEQFWLRGEVAAIARWVRALPPWLVREHARLLLTTALYLLNTVHQAPWEQRSGVHQEVQQIMALVENALHQQGNPATSVGVFASQDNPVRSAEEVVLRRRLRLLHASLVLSETVATANFQQFLHAQQEIQELEPGEEILWQMIPLHYNFTFYFSFQQEGAQLMPRLLEAKRQANASGSQYASIKVRQWLALVAQRAGRLHLAYEESVEVLALIEQMAGYAPLKGYFEQVQVDVLYHWNRLEEARTLLETLLPVATTWQQLDVFGEEYIRLVQIELARGDPSAARQALSKMEHLLSQKRFPYHQSTLPALRAQCWLAQGDLQAAAAWAAGAVFPEGQWDHSLYEAFPVVIRVYFMQRRWTEAAELLDRWKGRLDLPTNLLITITFLAQSLVALSQTGQREQAHALAARLFALTEPEGYLRVYLDEGEPMREALLALCAPGSQQHEATLSTITYASKLLATFEQEARGASTPFGATPAPESVLFSSQKPVASAAAGVFLTHREQEVLRLLATGATNQEIAQTLVISVATAKKHVSNLLGKLGVTRRTQAIIQARILSLL